MSSGGRDVRRVTRGALRLGCSENAIPATMVGTCKSCLLAVSPPHASHTRVIAIQQTAKGEASGAFSTQRVAAPDIIKALAPIILTQRNLGNDEREAGYGLPVELLCTRHLYDPRKSFSRTEIIGKERREVEKLAAERTTVSVHLYQSSPGKGIMTTSVGN